MMKHYIKQKIVLPLQAKEVKQGDRVHGTVVSVLREYFG